MGEILLEPILIPVIIFLIIALIRYRRRFLDIQKSVESKAMDLFNSWRARAEEEFRKRENTIREDAIRHSISAIVGRVGEQIAPIVIFSSYGVDPRDLRFLGTPVDFIAFKGLSSGGVEEIIFIEIKTGKVDRLSEREEQVRKAVESGKVKWVTIHLPKEIEKLKEAMVKEIRS